MDLSTRLQNFFNSRKKDVQNVVNQVPKPIQQFGNSLGKALVNSTPLLGLTQRNTPVGQVGQEIRNTVQQGVPASLRLSPIGQAQQYINPLRKINPLQNAQNQFSDVFKAGKLGATIVGAPKMTLGTGLGAMGLGGGINKAFGGSFTEGAAMGVATAPTLGGIGRFTNPLINKGVAKFAPQIANPVGKFFAQAGTRGALNVPEGMVMSQALGRDPLDPMGMGIDFAAGLAGRGPLTKAGSSPMTKQDAIMVKRYPEIIAKHEQGIRDLVVRFEKSFGQLADPANPHFDQFLEEDANHIWKQMHGNNRTPPKDMKKKIGEIYDGFENWRNNIIANREKGLDDLDPFAMGLLGNQKPKMPAPLQLRNTPTGSYTNVQGVDNPLLGKKGQIQPPEFTPSNAPSVRDDSVIDDIKGGFDLGRKARDEAENISKGSLGQRLRSELVDRFTPVYDFVKKAGRELPAEKNPYKQMRLLAGTSGKTEAFIEKNFKPILEKERPRQPDLSALLVIDRERELTGRGLIRKRTSEELDQAENELRAKYGDEGYASLQNSAKEIRNVGSKLLDQLHEAGIIDDMGYQSIKKNNEFYAPFEAVSHMADNMEKGHGTGSYNVSSQDAVKRIGDYSGDVADPIESLLRKVPKVINLVEKNKAMQSLVNLRNEAPDVYKDIIVPLKGDPPPGSGVINVFEGGRNVKYAVPDVVESAVKNLDAETGGILVKIGSIQAKMLRAGATGLNIGFIPVNIVRDVQDSLTTEISENGVKAVLSFLGSYPRAIFAAAKRDDLYRQWQEAGGSQSTMTEQIFKKTPKKLAELSGVKPKLLNRLNPLKAGVGLIEFANRVGEQSTRIAKFKSDTDRGVSPMEAAFKSRDISLDFAKAGNKVKVLNQVIPFLNAGIQGSEKMLRLYKNNPKAAIAASSVLFGVPTVALFTHNSQFNDYDDIPDAEKQNNWIILARDRTPEEIQSGDSPIGVKIPKGFLPRIITNGIESGMQFMKDGDPSTFPKVALDTAEGLSPVGLPVSEDRLGKTLSTILPPWLKAGVEWQSNTNTFFGSKIVPQGLENLPASEQYKDKTPGVYKLAGKLTGLSPLKIENTVNTTTGGLGRQLATLAGGDLEGGTVKQVSRRFMDIRDGVKADKAYKEVAKEKEYTALRNKQLKEAMVSGNEAEVERLSEGMSSQQINSLKTSIKNKEEKALMSPEQKAYDLLSKEEKERMLRARPELKTELDLIESADASETKPSEKGKVFKFKADGKDRTVELNLNIKRPELTGDNEIDQKLLSRYKSKITTEKNDVYTLLENKKITTEKAKELLSKLNEKYSTGGTGTGKKAKKGLTVDFRTFANKLGSIKPTKVSVSRSAKSSFKPVTVKAPSTKELKVKELKFKGKPLKMKRK